ELELFSIRDRVADGLARGTIPYYRRVINATGVILHTGLGRAPLAAEAVEALRKLAPHPVRVEVNLESGERGGREEGIAALLRELTGCEAATVVNNNAGATLLILAALARGRKVLLSRGEMVEIGGSFRIPEIMEESGATLVGVGTSNRTHARDYRNPIDESTGLILKVHTSNYRIEGFTCEVELEELVAIGKESHVPVVHDMGSGCLIDLQAHGRPWEPEIRESIAAGADLVCFSGDKLLGGPQAGIILGKHTAVERCRKHPLYRALRCDRLTYVALEATLGIYLEGDAAAMSRIPALERLFVEPDELRKRARRLARKIGKHSDLECEVISQHSLAGSGSLPTRDLPTWVVRVHSSRFSADQLARELRTGNPPILARVREDAVLFDVRTIADPEFPLLEERLGEIISGR
ncbi:MAG: L-seryl-tRNA(Sec) selenium transferase, partial [Planctomycetota bacterium]